MNKRFSPTTRCVFILAVSLLTSGCAFRYFDSSTGIDHVIGFGHLRMRVPPAAEERLAIMRSVSALGLSTGVCDGNFAVTAGWAEDERVEIFDANTSVRVDRPSGGLLNAAIGSLMPASIDSESTEASQTEVQE